MNNNFIKQKEHDPFCWKYTTHIILSWFSIFYSYHDLPSSMFCHTKDSMLSSKFPYNAKYFYKMKQSFLYFTLLCLTIQLTTVRGLHTMVDNNIMSYKHHDALEAVLTCKISMPQNMTNMRYDYITWYKQHDALEAVMLQRFISILSNSILVNELCALRPKDHDLNRDLGIYWKHLT